MKGIEPPTPSLPWKCSTPELHWLFSMPPRANEMSGRRDSNPRPSAWKADALPTELLPLDYLLPFNYPTIKSYRKWGW